MFEIELFVEVYSFYVFSDLLSDVCIKLSDIYKCLADIEVS